MDNSVMIFKSETQEATDPYVEELRSNGFKPYLFHVIMFEYSNLESLKQKIKRPDDYIGIIFTSERCVKGLEMALGPNECKDLMSRWKSHQIFCTGLATQRCLLDKTDLHGQVGHNQRADGILDLIITGNRRYSRPVLYPCGELAASKDTLRSSLQDEGMNCDPVVIYKTLPNPSLSSQLQQFYTNNGEKWGKTLVFFSPSGVKTFIESISAFCNLTSLADSQFVAIGPTTATELEKQGLQVWAQAMQPSPDGVLACLTQTM